MRFLVGWATLLMFPFALLKVGFGVAVDFIEEQMTEWI